MDRLFENSTVDFLSKALDCRTAQHKAIANNIANVNTPAYKGTEVAFKDQLQMVLNSEPNELNLKDTDRRHITHQIPLQLKDVRPRPITDPTTSMRSDGNNVDLDKEMATLAENTMSIGALTRLVSDKMRGLRMAIEGR